MTGWLARIDKRRVAQSPLGVRGRNLALDPLLAPQPLALSDAERVRLACWLQARGSRVRWPSLAEGAADEVLLARLLEAGWCRVELQLSAEGNHAGRFEPCWVEWLDSYGLRAQCGIAADSPADEEVVELWRGWQPRAAALAPLAASLLQGLPSATLERRLAVGRALDDWLADGRWGSERDFSRHALGRSRAFGDADSAWLAEAGVDLAACGVGPHGPHLFVAGPVSLWDGTECLASRRLLAPGAALAPELLAAVTRADGRVDAIRVVQQLAVFGRLGAEDGAVLTLCVPAAPPPAWRRALAALFGALRVPVQVGCDLSPAGMALALDIGALAGAAGCPWQPWQMAVPTVVLQQAGQPLDEASRAALARLAARPLPAALATLAAQLDEAGCWLGQDILFEAG